MAKVAVVARLREVADGGGVPMIKRLLPHGTVENDYISTDKRCRRVVNLIHERLLRDSVTSVVRHLVPGVDVGRIARILTSRGTWLPGQVSVYCLTAGITLAVPNIGVAARSNHLGNPCGDYASVLMFFPRSNKLDSFHK